MCVRAAQKLVSYMEEENGGGGLDCVIHSSFPPSPLFFYLSLNGHWGKLAVATAVRFVVVVPSTMRAKAPQPPKGKATTQLRPPPDYL